MVFSQLFDQMMQRQRRFVLRAGYTRTGEQVGIPATIGGNLAQQFIIGVWRADENSATLCRIAVSIERRRLFYRYVCHQNGVDTHARALGVKLINTTVKHQVGVHQQANRIVGCFWRIAASISKH